MSNNISTALEPVRVEKVSGQQKPKISDKANNFSESFRDANRELNTPDRVTKNINGTTKDELVAKNKNTTDNNSENDPSAQSTLVVQNGSTQEILADGSKIKRDIELSGLFSANQVFDEQVQTDTSALDSIVSPEVLVGVLEQLAIHGKELPISPQALSLGPKPSAGTQAVVVQPASASALSTNSTFDTRSSGLMSMALQADTPDGFTLTPLAKGLDAATAIVKPLTSDNKLLSLDSLLSKTVSTEDISAKGILAKGIVEQSLDEGLLSHFVKEDASTPAQLTPDTLASQLGSNAATPASKTQLSMMVPFQQAQWGQGVAERVMWMSSQGIQEAEIHLDPPDLGPLQVKISVVNEQTQVSFVVQHSSVRDALDQSSMRLREMFEAQGINLGDVDVSDQSEQHAEKDSEQSRAERLSTNDDDPNQTNSETPLVLSGDGYSLINTYV
jgi:flagellar hook-length control protein FliK